MINNYLEIDGIAISPIGNLDHACPSCGVIHENMKRSKTPCPDCGKTIFIRSRPYDGQKVFLSSAEAALVEKQWTNFQELKRLLSPVGAAPEFRAMYEDLMYGDRGRSKIDWEAIEEYFSRTPQQIQSDRSEDGNWYSTKYKAANGLLSPAFSRLINQGYGDEETLNAIMEESISSAFNSPEKITELALRRAEKQDGNIYHFKTRNAETPVTLEQIGGIVKAKIASAQAGKNWTLKAVKESPERGYYLEVGPASVILCDNQAALQAKVLLRKAQLERDRTLTEAIPKLFPTVILLIIVVFIAIRCTVG